MFLLRSCFLLLFIFVMFGVQPAQATLCLGDQAASVSYLVYIVPRISATKLYQDWAPFLERLGKENGLCFTVHIPEDFTEFEQAIQAGIPDFVFLNPYHQLTVVRKPGYVPLVRDQQSELSGVLVVRKDSPLKDIQQLEGTTVAFPSPNAYAASLLIRALLAQKNIHITANYVGSHSNVYRAVALGAKQTGGGANTTLDHEPKELQSQLRILFTTPNFMPHPFSAHPRIPLSVREKVIAGFLNIATEPSGRGLLKAIQIAQPIRADYTRDYKNLEQLKLERFAVRGSD
jgi:phosphonate transport system substrate-binding protein